MGVPRSTQRKKNLLGKLQDNVREGGGKGEYGVKEAK